MSSSKLVLYEIIQMLILPEKNEYLGHLIDANGVHANPRKNEAMFSWPKPNNQKKLRLGLVFGMLN